MKILPSDNNYRTQDQAITFHNDRKEAMLSLADIYQLWKENNTEAIESLKKDFDPRWLNTSTRIIYDINNLSGKVIHHFGSTVTKQKEIAVKEIPVCQPTYLKDLLNIDEGLDYIRALIDDKKASKEQITNFFTALSGKKPEDIRFWTPTQEERSNRQVRCVQLFFGDGRFYVYGYGWMDYGNGVSRGVIVQSAKQTAKRGRTK